MSRPLLPSGLADVLPPLAAAEFRMIHHFLKNFMAFGYQPVIPPLAEYTTTMLGGQGEATSHHIFRFADPLSPQILALRADMTGQIARIADTSLGKEKRPLRLCYAGYTLRTSPEALKSRRQHTQVGLERFGDASTRGTAEILAIAVQALSSTGLEGLTIDLHFPAIIPSLLDELHAVKHPAIRDAVRLKDTARLRQLGADRIAEIIELSGPATTVLKQLEAIKQKDVQHAVRNLTELCDELAKLKLPVHCNIDMLDLSGYGYYTGVGYALYWNGGNLEVGRGGCYRTDGGEQAVGFTLYINDLLALLPTEAPTPIAEIPYGTPLEEVLKKQRDGFVTVLV